MKDKLKLVLAAALLFFVATAQARAPEVLRSQCEAAATAFMLDVLTAHSQNVPIQIVIDAYLTEARIAGIAEKPIVAAIEDVYADGAYSTRTLDVLTELCYNNNLHLLKE